MKVQLCSSTKVLAISTRSMRSLRVEKEGQVQGPQKWQVAYVAASHNPIGRKWR